MMKRGREEQEGLSGEGAGKKKPHVVVTHDYVKTKLFEHLRSRICDKRNLWGTVYLVGKLTVYLISFYLYFRFISFPYSKAPRAAMDRRYINKHYYYYY
jgi:hypothetical protein